jgi:hypothetical protein
MTIIAASMSSVDEKKEKLKRKENGKKNKNN